VAHSLSRLALLISATRSLAQHNKWFSISLSGTSNDHLPLAPRENPQIHDGSQFMPWSFVFISNPLAESRYAMDATDVPCHLCRH
jgi:hypothetical protein